ncbi:aminoglycoside phosphotransferase family protein [Streptacidiphilus sp. EB103A]|uniref:aminoglycoside phosphotransferase family protein n=1 Tax=Streptacidiphilus sp. EB103A TaxID=3156275 RepID=UPI0035137608
MRPNRATSAAAQTSLILSWAQGLVGLVDSVRDVSWPRESSRVWELNGTGGRHFLKLSPDRLAFDRETYAYRGAAPKLGDGRAPVLVDADPVAMALLLTAVPGAVVKGLTLTAGEEGDIHRQAGALLRRLHDTATPSAHTRLEAAADTSRLLDQGARQLAVWTPLLTAAQRLLVGDLIDELRGTSELPAAFLHGDWQPRNWLWSGELAAVDFEQSRYGPAVDDFVLLASGPWWLDRPDLRESFISGYGRTLNGAEQRALRGLAGLAAAGGIARGTAAADLELVRRGQLTLNRLLTGDFA